MLAYSQMFDLDNAYSTKVEVVEEGGSRVCFSLSIAILYSCRCDRDSNRCGRESRSAHRHGGNGAGLQKE